jgi:hypothetical protein
MTLRARERDQEICDNRTRASVIKSPTMGGTGVKNVQNCMTLNVTSFMDDSLNKF